MAQGFSSPLRRDNRGRILLTSGPIHLGELLGIALGDGDSENPFQEPVLGEFMIFDVASETLFSDVAIRIREIFEAFRLDELAELQDSPDNLKGKRGAVEGEWEMEVRYVDLETDLPGTLRVIGDRTGAIRAEVI